MPRVYTVEFENVTWANASGDIEIFSIQAADDKVCAIKKIKLKVISEVAEAQEEWLRIRAIAGHTSAGTGGATPTPRPLSVNDSAAGFTARTNDTAIASGGTARNLLSDAFQVRAGYEEEFAPEDWMWNTQAEFWVLRLMAAVADDVVASGTLWVVEVP
jgi:hypothetical protein